MRMVSETPMKRPRRKLLWFAGIAVVLVAAAIASFMLRSKPQTHAAARATSIPVTVAPAAQRDVPIFLQALGTVQAAFTVSVRSQIDGKVVTVNFVEGQEVKKGDTLAEIDSRALKAALDQATAKKAQDAAQLVSAQKDLTRFQELGRKAFETQQNIDQHNGSGNTLNTGRFFIGLKPREERTSSALEVIARLRPQLAKVEGVNLFLQPSQDITVGGRISRGQFQYTLQDASLDELNTWAPKMLAKLKTLPQLADVSSDLQGSAPQLTIHINRDAAARFGIQPQVIDDTLNDAFGQRQVGQYFTQTNSYFIVLEALPNLQKSTAVLDQIYVKAASTGQLVPLSALVDADTRSTGPLSVSHQGQFPAVTLSFNLQPGVALGDAVTAIDQAEGEIGKPQSLLTSFQGNAQAFQSSLSNEPLLILAALLVVYVILGVLYESYVHPLTILSTLPSAGVGALMGLWLGGFDLSVIGIIGIILLIGIVKKNGIMLVDFAISRERQGMSAEVAIREACLLRFRPIMMTTMATLLGGLPLMLGHGSGSELRQPLGYAMVGGLIVSQMLTLFTTPVVYLYLDRLQNWLRGERSHESPVEALAAAE